MAEMDFGRGAGALCPFHPEHAASRTCARCGNFMCELCSEAGTRPMCPTCRERAGVARPFALTRDNWSVGALLETSWEAFKREWVMICVGFLVIIAASFAGGVVSQVLSVIGGLSDQWAVQGLFMVSGYILSGVLQGLVTLGFLRMLFDVLEGRRADVARMFTQFHKAIPYLLTLLLIYLLVIPVLLVTVGGALGAAAFTGGLSALQTFDWTSMNAGNPSGNGLMQLFSDLAPSLMAMLLVGGTLYTVVGTWLLMPLLLVQPELARSENTNPIETLRRCYAYARGQRLSMLGILLLTGLIGIAGFLACCVGVIPAVGLGQLMVAGLYLALSNGAEEG